MTDLHIKVAGMWKKSKNISVNISGKWRDAREVWIRVNGKWIKGWSNRKWVTGSNMPTGRHYCHAKVLNGFYYVVGGVDPSGSYDNGISNKNERYDISKGVWTEMASCPASKVNGAAEVTSKGFHVMNGTANYYSHYVFNPSSNTWERKTHGIPAQKPAIYYDLHADSIYKFGGFDERALKYTERYDVSRDTWTSLGEVPTARWGGYSGSFEGSGKVWFCGGATNSGVVTEVNEVYDINTNSWSAAASMLSAGSFSPYFSVSNGKMYVISHSPQIFNMKQNIWSWDNISPPFQINHTEAGVYNGSVYIAGGVQNGVWASNGMQILNRIE